MKHDYTNETIQTAIDAACNETAESYSITSRLLTLQDYKGSYYVTEAPARLALAKAFLARLPEPTPPVVDGKTPGQVVFFTLNPHGDWAKLLAGDKALYEAAASAVIAAFGGQNLEAAIARMEAVDVWSVYKHHPSPFSEEALGGVKASLIAAARGDKDDVNSRYEIVGWRYADEPTPEPAWQPAVGDTVKLKSGGPVMTVDAIVDDTVNCEWHTTDGMPQCRHYYPACLEPATKEEQP